MQRVHAGHEKVFWTRDSEKCSLPAILVFPVAKGRLSPN